MKSPWLNVAKQIVSKNRELFEAKDKKQYRLPREQRHLLYQLKSAQEGRDSGVSIEGVGDHFSPNSYLGKNHVARVEFNDPDFEQPNVTHIFRLGKDRVGTATIPYAEGKKHNPSSLFKTIGEKNPHLSPEDVFSAAKAVHRTHQNDELLRDEIAKARQKSWDMLDEY